MRIASIWAMLVLFEISTRVTRALITTGDVALGIIGVILVDGTGLGIGTWAICWLADEYPMEVLTWRHALLVVLPALVVIAFLNFSLAYAATRAFGQTPPPFAESLMLSLHPRIFVSFLILGVAYAVRHYFVLRERTREAARLETEVLRAEIVALRSQLQPHFLLNVLNVIGGQVRTAPAVAEEMIGRVGNLLRMSAAQVERPLTTIGEEIDFLGAYLEVQRLRLGDRLRARITVENELLTHTLPSFLIQPLVENAVKHGVERALHPSLITIDVRREETMLVIEVNDDGAGGSEAGSDGLGLTNTKARLQRHYGTDVGLTVAPRPSGGTRVTLRLPVR
jgi:signal transduction histidine kinase